MAIFTKIGTNKGISVNNVYAKFERQPSINVENTEVFLKIPILGIFFPALGIMELCLEIIKTVFVLYVSTKFEPQISINVENTAVFVKSPFLGILFPFLGIMGLFCENK